MKNRSEQNSQYNQQKHIWNASLLKDHGKKVGKKEGGYAEYMEDSASAVTFGDLLQQQLRAREEESK